MMFGKTGIFNPKGLTSLEIGVHKSLKDLIYEYKSEYYSSCAGTSNCRVDGIAESLSLMIAYLTLLP